MAHKLQWRGVTQLFVIGTRVFGRIFEDVSRAGGETTVCEDAHLNLARVDRWEVREATGPEFWSEFWGKGGRARKGNGGGGVRRGASVSVEHRRGDQDEEMDALELRHQE